MKFINYLENITGVGIYPLVSFLIFFFFFMAVSLYLLRTKKSHFDLASKMPLDSDSPANDFIYEKR